MNAAWRPVVGFESFYEVSDTGAVRNAITLHTIAQQTDKHGRKLVHLKVNQLRTARRVHRLVLEAFVGTRPAGMEGCHNDGNASNNVVSNLRWDTHAANVADTKRHGTNPIGERNAMAKLNAATVIRIRCERARGATYASLGRRFGVDPETARDAAIGKRWGHV